MTDDRYTEPFRALDGLEARDKWDGIVARADDPAVPAVASVGARRPGRRVLAAAAVIVGLVAGAVGVASLGNGSDGEGERLSAGPTAEDPASMYGRRWTAVAVEVDGEPQDLHAAGGLVLTFDGARAAFTPAMGCPFAVEGPLEGDRWRPSYVDENCTISAANDSRLWLTALVGGVTPFATDPRPPELVVAVDAESLTLTGERIEMTFQESEAPSELAGTTWAASRFSEAGADRPLLPTTRGGPPMLRFTSSDGRPSDRLGLSGFAGCNDFHVVTLPLRGGGGPPVSATDAGLGIDSFATNFAGCAEDLIAQEVWVQAVLEDDPLVVLQGDRLVLWTGTARIEWTKVSPSGRAGADPAPTAMGEYPSISTPPRPTISAPTTTAVPVDGEGRPTEPVTPLVPPGRNPNDSEPGEWRVTHHERPSGLWLVSSITENGVQRSLTPGWAGGPIFVDFGIDGEVHILGCNAYAAGLDWNGLEVTTGRFVGHGNACPEASDLLEQQVVDVFAGPSEVGVDPPDGLAASIAVSSAAGTVNLRPAVIVQAQARCGDAGGAAVDVEVRGSMSSAGTVELRDRDGAVVDLIASIPVEGGRATIAPSGGDAAVAIIRNGDGAPAGSALVTPMPEGSICR